MLVPMDFVVAALVTLLVVVDPIGLTPAFLGATAGLPQPARGQVAIRASVLAFAIASEMVFGVRITRQSAAAEQAIEEHVRNVAAFPLAIPLMAGPGAITATVLLAGRADGDPLRLAVLIGIIAVVMATCLIVFLFATRVERLFGKTGNAVLSRLLGVLLAAMAVQFVVDGVRALLSG